MSDRHKIVTKTGLGVEAELDQKILIERAHRIRLLRPRDLVCRVDFKGEVHTVKVRDVSESGIGFLGSDFPSVRVGDLYEVYFVSNQESFPGQIEVIRINNGVVGVRFLGHPETWRSFLRSHFEIELEAGTLHLVDSKLLKKPEGEGAPWWYFAPEGRELYMTIVDDRVVRYHLVFRGHYFGGDEFSFRYGRVRESAAGEMGVKDANQIIPSSERPPVELAQRFLSNIEHLPELYLNQILQSLDK